MWVYIIIVFYNILSFATADYVVLADLSHAL